MPDTHASLRAEAQSLLSELGVPEAAFTSGARQVVSPVDGSVLASVPMMEAGEVSEAIGRAHEAYLPGAACPRLGAANWFACSAKNCARIRMRWAVSYRWRWARRLPKGSGKFRR